MDQTFVGYVPQAGDRVIIVDPGNRTGILAKCDTWDGRVGTVAWIAPALSSCGVRLDGHPTEWEPIRFFPGEVAEAVEITVLGQAEPQYVPGRSQASS